MNITNVTTTTNSIPVRTSQVAPSSGDNLKIEPIETQVMLSIYATMGQLNRGEISQQEAANRIKNAIGNPQEIGGSSLFGQLPLDMQKQINAIYNDLCNGAASKSQISELDRLLKSIISKVSIDQLIAQDVLNIRNAFFGASSVTTQELQKYKDQLQREVNPQGDPNSIYNRLSADGKRAYDDAIRNIDFAIAHPEYQDSDMLLKEISTNLLNLWTEIGKSSAPASPISGNARITSQLAAGRI